MYKMLLMLAVALTCKPAHSFADDPPLPPVGSCCSPADVADYPPYEFGCSAECSEHLLSDTPQCAERGQTTGPAVTGGDCHLAGPRNSCTPNQRCTKNGPSWVCIRAFCTTYTVECYWEPNGTAEFEYVDCTGTDCWGGAIHTACSSY